MYSEERRIKKYSSKSGLSSFIESAQSFSDSKNRPFAPLNMSENWRVFKNSSLYKTSIILILGVVIVFFFLGKQSTNSNAATVDIKDVASTSSSTSTPKQIVVYVTGEVNSPGVVNVDEGSRIFEAIEMAGGATALANTSQCDLASKVIDGTTIYIPKQGENTNCSRASAAGTASPSAASGGVVSLNTASQAELETLPGVGPTLAQAIISYREENGGFSSVNDLRKVKGIGDKKFADLKDLVSA